MSRKPLTPEEFKAIYSRVPRLCVELVVMARGGIVLALRSLPTWNNMWHLPGGTVLYKETIEQAATRVASDELGITIKIGKTLGYAEYPSEQEERGFGWSVTIVLLCETDAEIFKVNEDASRAEIFYDLPENMLSEQKVFLRDHWNTISKSYE